MLLWTVSEKGIKNSFIFSFLQGQKFFSTREAVKDRGKKWGGVVISFCEQIFATQTLQ